MKSYVVYAEDSGEITSFGTCQDCDFEFQNSGGGSLIEAEGSPNSHYIQNGELVAYTEEQIALKANRPSDAIGWSNAPIGWVYPDASVVLENKRAILWEQTKLRRSALETATFAHDGHTYDADTLSQQRIASAVLLATIAPETFAVDWTLSDNTTTHLNASDLVSLGVALGVRTSQIFNQAAAIRARIEAATTLSDLESIAQDEFFVG